LLEADAMMCLPFSYEAHCRSSTLWTPVNGGERETRTA